MDEQGGFRAGRGCNNQIFAVRQTVEKTIEKDRVVYMAFVDLEKAYDNVNRESYGGCWKSMVLKEDYCEQFRCCMRTER